MGQRRIKVAYQSGAVADSGMKSHLGLKPTGSHPCSEYWQGDMQKSLLGPADSESGQSQFECIPGVLESMERCMKKPRPGKGGPPEEDDDSLMIDRGKYLVSQFKALCRSFAVLAESYVAEKAATTESDQSHCGYTAFVHATISQVIATMRSMTDSNISESKADEANDTADLDDLLGTSEQLGHASKDAGCPRVRSSKPSKPESWFSHSQHMPVCRTRPTPRTLWTSRKSAGTRLEGVWMVWQMQ